MKSPSLKTRSEENKRVGKEERKIINLRSKDRYIREFV